MVVNVVHITGFSGLEPEDHSPVCTDGHCVKSPQVAVQRMQSPARRVKVRRLPCTGERSQDQPQFGRVARLDTSARAVREELGQAFVPEVPDHFRV